MDRSEPDPVLEALDGVCMSIFLPALTRPTRTRHPADSHALAGVIQRKCACGARSRSEGECEECRRKRTSGGSWIQTRLEIGSPDDPAEREAEAIAHNLFSGSPHPGIAGETPRIRAFADPPKGLPAEIPASVERALAAPGVEMEAGVRRTFEQKLGHDFSAVRVHSDGPAAVSSQDLGAEAYTVGSDIFFSAGRYSPGTLGGQRLLAHELTHVVQQRGGSTHRIQRSLEGCRDLINDPNAVSLVSGTVVHRIIQRHFMGSASGAVPVAIPGASAGALRTDGLCGKPSPIIDPQVVGGRAGLGFPDLARITPGRILQVAELKPAAIPCLIDGENQELRYIDQGNSQDPEQVAWRASLGVTVVSPMLESAYTPPNILIGLPGVGSAEIRTSWCTPGLLAYSVRLRGQPIPVPQRVPETRRQPARVRSPAQRSQLEQIRQFVRQVVESGEAAEEAARRFLEANPELRYLLIGAAIAVVVATIAEDIATLGAGLLDDPASIAVAYALVRVAQAGR